MVEILKDADGDRRRSRESLSSVKYESGSEAGEEVSMGVEWNGVSTDPLKLNLTCKWSSLEVQDNSILLKGVLTGTYIFLTILPPLNIFWNCHQLVTILCKTTSFDLDWMYAGNAVCTSSPLPCPSYEGFPSKSFG